MGAAQPEEQDAVGRLVFDPRRQSIEEAQAFVTKYDKNKDGKLDLDELSEAIAAMSDDKQFFALNPPEKEREETDIG